MSAAASPVGVKQSAILESVGRETTALLDRVLEVFLEIDLQGQLVVDGLTGGHVLTYLSRQADRMADHLLEATGRQVPPFDADRQWEVDRGGDRPGAVLIEDFVSSSERLNDALAGVTDWAALDETVRDMPGQRLVQLMVHHADLGRPWASLPQDDAAVAVVQLPRVMSAELFRTRLIALADQPLRSRHEEDGTTVIEGDPRALLVWASGRTTGDETIGSGLPHLTHRTWF